jgi:hypothetical protein
MNPTIYTAKSMAGPILFVVAAYLYGQSVGRREGRGALSGLAALPSAGRIPMATVRRALKKLPKKSQACEGMTASALREGMEIEREHRDITRGAVGKTAKIAAAHICERPDYYRRIKRFVEK